MAHESQLADPTKTKNQKHLKQFEIKNELNLQWHFGPGSSWPEWKAEEKDN